MTSSKVLEIDKPPKYTYTYESIYGDTVPPDCSFDNARFAENEKYTIFDLGDPDDDINTARVIYINDKRVEQQLKTLLELGANGRIQNVLFADGLPK